ncbi:MAG: hypothetical protein LBB67_05905 [Oscillospiraceae bacterium]|jgi:hypothetical protein|nr:hypothetical protein [Oscillospiraceae bacterium]
MTENEIRGILKSDKRQLNNIFCRIRQLRSGLESVTPGNGVRVQGSANGDKLADTMSEIIRLEGEAAALTEHVKCYIKLCDNQLQMSVLELRYVRGYDFCGIAKLLHYSEGYLYQINAEAIKIISKKTKIIAQKT